MSKFEPFAREDISLYSEEDFRRVTRDARAQVNSMLERLPETARKDLVGRHGSYVPRKKTAADALPFKPSVTK